MDQKTADKVIAGIDEWWQERRANFAMDTETHNREAGQVEELKKRMLAMVDTPAETADKGKK